MMNRTISNMRTYAYELYKIQWLQRISTERHLDALRNYVEEEIPEKFEMYRILKEMKTRTLILRNPQIFMAVIMMNWLTDL